MQNKFDASFLTAKQHNIPGLFMRRFQLVNLVHSVLLPKREASRPPAIGPGGGLFPFPTSRQSAHRTDKKERDLVSHGHSRPRERSDFSRDCPTRMLRMRRLAQFAARAPEFHRRLVDRHGREHRSVQPPRREPGAPGGGLRCCENIILAHPTGCILKPLARCNVDKVLFE